MNMEADLFSWKGIGARGRKTKSLVGGVKRDFIIYHRNPRETLIFRRNNPYSMDQNLHFSWFFWGPKVGGGLLS